MRIMACAASWNSLSAPRLGPQALDASVAYVAALRKAVKAQGAEKLVILNPGVAIDAGLAAQVHVPTARRQQQPLPSCAEFILLNVELQRVLLLVLSALPCVVIKFTIKRLPWHCGSRSLTKNRQA
jgi:hypothetical protein